MEKGSLSDIADLMSILGVESRLRIVVLLSEAEYLCVNALACRLGISQSAVSQHLRILSLKGLVSSERDGYYTHYSLNREVVSGFLEDLENMDLTSEPVEEARCKPDRGGKCAKEKKGAASRSG